MALPTSSQKAAEEFLHDFHIAADSLDASRVSPLYTAEGVLNYGNDQPRQGRETIAEFFAGVFPLLAYMHHESELVDVISDRIWLKSKITYEVTGDPAKERFTIPVVGLFVIQQYGEDAGKIASLDVVGDISPVFQRIQEILAKKQAA